MRVVDASLLAVMAVPGIVLLIPKFLVLQRLGMFDTYSAMTIPLFADAVGILLMKTAFEAVPIELEEAALIDGAGVFTRFSRIMLPLTVPALITVVIISFQGSWNEFTHFLVATPDPDLATLNLGIARLTAGGLGSGQQFPLKLALATLSITADRHRLRLLQPPLHEVDRQHRHQVTVPSDELAVAGDDAAVVDDERPRRVVHHRRRHRVGGDDDEIGGGADGEPGVDRRRASRRPATATAVDDARPPREATSTHPRSARRGGTRPGRPAATARSSTSPLPYGDQ